MLTFIYFFFAILIRYSVESASTVSFQNDRHESSVIKHESSVIKRNIIDQGNGDIFSHHHSGNFSTIYGDENINQAVIVQHNYSQNNPPATFQKEDSSQKNGSKESLDVSFPQHILKEQPLIKQHLNSTTKVNLRRFKDVGASFTVQYSSTMAWATNVGGYYYESTHPYANSLTFSSQENVVATGILGFLVKFSNYTQTQATNDVFQFRDGRFVMSLLCLEDVYILIFFYSLCVVTLYCGPTRGSAGALK